MDIPGNFWASMRAEGQDARATKASVGYLIGPGSKKLVPADRIDLH